MSVVIVNGQEYKFRTEKDAMEFQEYVASLPPRKVRVEAKARLDLIKK